MIIVWIQPKTSPGAEVEKILTHQLMSLAHFMDDDGTVRIELQGPTEADERAALNTILANHNVVMYETEE